VKILITGHRGFIGQNMFNALKDEHELSTFEWNDPIPDIKGFDWVIHLGAISSTTERDVELVMRQNYDFSCWLLDQCGLNGINFQYASSASVYGFNREFSEYSAVDPRSPYSWSKFLFDRHVDRVRHGYLKDFVVQGFRYFNVYGPHEDHKKDQASPYYKFTQQAKTTGKIKLFYGSHHYFRDFIHVDRVIDIHKKFFKVKESGLWNVGTGQVTSFQTIAEEIAKQYDAQIEYISMPETIKSQYQVYTCADLTKLRRTLGEENCS
jgi:ADP-L-glycero-D-manno-heptose 6-epimerase